MRELQEIKVVLQNPEGKYLSGSASNWRLTEDRASAIVFDFFAQRVELLAARLSERLGFRLEPVRLPPQEVYETCDACQCLVMPRQVFFDGRHFLCLDCKAELDAKPQAVRLAA
jgi:hypothetical protein